MTDDLTKKRPQDASKVNVHEKWQLEYWTKKFGVTAEKLKKAVATVGVGAVKVEEYMKKHK